MNDDPGASGGRFRMGNWEVDSASGELWREGQAVRLRPKVMELLLALADHPGQLVGKQDLLDRVWPDVLVTESTLTVTIRELRKALGDDAGSARVIETIPRRGYRLLAPISCSRADRTGSPSLGLLLVGEGSALVLSVGSHVIGRSQECDLTVDSSTVSRRHALLRVDEHGVSIEDLGSKNGTFVGESRVEEPLALAPGDTIRLGHQGPELRLVPAEESTRTEMSTQQTVPAAVRSTES